MPIITDISQAVVLLKEGGIVAIPTETVYGLGGDALNVEAVAKIFAAKNRPSFDPLIVHVSNVEQAQTIAHLDDLAISLLRKFSPGPLTLVLPKKSVVPDLVTSGHPTVAIRIPNHPVALEVLRQSGLCIAAPSANPFGYTSPTTAQHVEEFLGSRIDAVLDGGTCDVGIESTIIDLSGNRPKVLRLGGLPYEALTEVLGELPLQTSSSTPHAPGMLISHYNPGISLKLFKSYSALLSELNNTDSDRIGLLYSGKEIRAKFAINLSRDGDLVEAAAKLFNALRSFNKADIDVIWVHELPEVGLGRAINDRLRRAQS